MRRLLALALVPILLAGVGACGREAVVPPSAIPSSYAPDDVVLQIDTSGGLIPVEYALTELPTVTVYGDGRVITQGPVIDIYPPPALPSLLVRTISAQGVQTLARAAERAGVGSGRDYGTPQVMDAGSTRFELLTRDGILVTSVPALGLDDGVSRAQREARRALVELRDALLDLPRTLGTDQVGEEKPYEPEAIAAVTRPWSDPALPGVENPPDRAWPGPALPGQATSLDMVAPDLRCATVAGPDVAPVVELAATANRITPWTWEGERYFVWFRPLLPDESTCSDLTRNP